MHYESCPRRNYVPKFMADFYGMIQRIPEISLSSKLRCLIHYLRRIDIWRKEEHQEPLSRRRTEDELWQIYSTKGEAWRMEMAILKFPGGYCWGYTKRVYQRRSPKPASQGGPLGWYGGLPTGWPSCWKYHGGTGRRTLWQIRRHAYGGLPCSIRIGLSLGLQFVSALVPSCSPCQAPL
jgi:hypothetical protein